MFKILSDAVLVRTSFLWSLCLGRSHRITGALPHLQLRTFHYLSSPRVTLPRSQCTSSSDAAKELDHLNNLGSRMPESIKVVKSQNDTREYRVVKLDNGLTALLISDLKPGEDVPSADAQCDGCVTEADAEMSSADEEDEGESEEDDEESDMDEDEDDEDEEPEENSGSDKSGERLSAAGLAIGTGCFSDPDDIPGLAHFLEHMVFMGSEKYPDENQFDAFIKKYGGGTNAHTDCERTMFYFDIHQPYIRAALDRFAHFFISPLLKKDTLDREVKAVDSEFDMSQNSDSCRKEQLFGLWAKKGHPMGKFMWGNKKSLVADPQEMKIDVYSRLREFYGRAYSATYMTLALQSKDSLDNMEKWVRDIFSAIPNNNKPKATFDHLMKPFDTPSFCKLVKMVPIKSIHQVEVNWSLPPQLCNYRVKPLHYLGWLVGHEGTGSILSYLKKKLWASSLTSGNGEEGFEQNSTMSVFSITVTLTEEGMDHVNEVLTVLFEYLTMLGREGPQERIFTEIKTIEDNEFRWIEQGDPGDYVEDICENMQIYPAEHYVTGDSLLMHYDPKVIKECQDALLPQNANILLMSERYRDKNICNLTEPWFQTKYSQEDIPSEWMQGWQDMTVRDIFHLPAVNEYIATDFTLKTADVPHSEYPVKINNNAVNILWYRKDEKFKVPKGYINMLLRTPVLYHSPLNICLFDLLLKILDLTLTEVAYAADVAQLTYKVTGSCDGISLKFSGLNHKLPKLFETVVDHIASLTAIPEDIFTSAVDQLGKTYFNQQIQPIKTVKEVRLSILEQNYWSITDRQAALPTASRQQLETFVKLLTQQFRLESLIQGNFTAQEAKDLEAYLLGKLQPAKLADSTLPEHRVLEVPQGDTRCRIKAFNQTDKNSAVTNYYQQGPGNIRNYVLNELIMMHMDEPCFDILRTREQLSYHVFCTNRNTFSVLGLSVTVCGQEDKHKIGYVEERIEAFLTEYGELLNKMKQEEFDTLMESLIRMKRVEDTHLEEEVMRNWHEITADEFLFDRLHKEIEMLSHVTLEEVRDWFKQHVLDKSSRRKLSIQIQGHVKDKESPLGDTDGGGDAEPMEQSVIYPSELNYTIPENTDNILYIKNIYQFKATCPIFPESRLL